jgi:hypothetical protein
MLRGAKQESETYINEEVLLSAKYIRGENYYWILRGLSFPFQQTLNVK